MKILTRLQTKDLSIVIPTYNRSEFVIRYMHYLSETQFGGCLYICDSSEEAHLEKTKRAIRELDLKYEVILGEYPGLMHFECMIKVSPLIKTPYVIQVGDDDMVIVPALVDCMEFLECNPDYSCVGGVTVLFRLKESGAHGQFLWSVEHPLKPIEDASASQRLVHYFNSYSPINYTVSRTELFRQWWFDDPNCKDRAFAVELLAHAIAVVQGKIKRLDRLFIVRQTHDRRYLLSDIYDWLTSPQWFPSYTIFEDVLIKELMEKDKINKEKAKEVVKKAFWSYLAKVLRHKWVDPYAKKKESFISKCREFARNIPFLRYGVQKFRAVRSRLKGSISLTTLLHPSCPYHNDFMSLYRIVINERLTFKSDQ